MERLLSRAPREADTSISVSRDYELSTTPKFDKFVLSLHQRSELRKTSLVANNFVCLVSLAVESSLVNEDGLSTTTPALSLPTNKYFVALR